MGNSIFSFGFARVSEVRHIFKLKLIQLSNISNIFPLEVVQMPILPTLCITGKLERKVSQILEMLKIH